MNATILRKAIIIDANPRESRTYANELRLRLYLKIEEIHPPYRKMSNYLYLMERRDIACLFAEQRLKDTGIATYSGLELGQYLRNQGSQIPFYILTNVVDDLLDFVGDEWGIAGVIAKGDFRKEDWTLPVGGRK